MIEITSPYSKDPIPVSLTADAYWAHQPPAVQALRNSQNFDLAMDLAKRGYVIDEAIMLWGWDAVSTMAQRVIDGYTWVPSVAQPNIPIGPGIINVWNIQSYDKDHAPAGSVIVSVNAADYPPFFVPTTPAPTVDEPLVGLAIGGGYYRPGMGAAKGGIIRVTDGQKVEQDGVEYIAHVGMSPMGPSVIFQKA